MTVVDVMLKRPPRSKRSFHPKPKEGKADLSDVVKVLDELLSCQQWTDKQYNLYHSMHALLTKHKDQMKQYRMTVKNKESILTNMRSQKWCSGPNQNKMENWVSGMKVEQYVHTDSPSKTIKLVVVFPKHGGFRLKIKYKKGTNTQLVIYLEDSTGETKAHFAAYHSGKDYPLCEDLPEFSKAYHILPRELATLSKRQLMSVVNEFILFYDRDHAIEKTPILHGVKVSLSEFVQSL